MWEQLLVERDNDSPYDEFIVPWLAKVGSERIWLAEFSARSGNPYPGADIVDLWRLYALLRVNDVCILRFQPRVDEEASKNTPWDGPNITLEHYIEMFRSLGFQIVNRETFHPFFHEIVMVEQSDDENAQIQITEVKWPGLMLGNMMFSRAGVCVRGGVNHVLQDIAQSSTMYWTYWRKYRKSMDLSVGWGSNSSWRTDFRRDYLIDGNYFYNVDVSPELRIDLSDMKVIFDASRVENATRVQRIELLRNRCFIQSAIRPDNDLWPYYDFFHEPA